ncbi:MAG TPA: ATP-binding cassette domain-containing protein [candidate division Zixibacteria bacterium]|jgi:phospholipid/cholesterol/gamma-HCH transport system ATP-binding protein
MIRLENVTFGYRDSAVLRNVSFQVERGKTLVIFGISGSGKSTILKLLAGLVRPQTGRIIVNETDMTGLRESEWQELRRQIGFVFQGGALFDSMTVGENVGFYLLEHTDQSMEEIEIKVRETLQFMNLSEDLIDITPDELSGGMQRRVAIGRAVAAIDPLIMLYDEPTTGLDPISTKAITEMIVKLRDVKGVTSIVVTHQIADAFEVSDHFIVLQQGVVAFDGTAEELVRSRQPQVRSFLTPFIHSIERMPAMHHGES